MALDPPLVEWTARLQVASYAVGMVTGIVGICAAIVAVLTYRGNARRERAKWAVQLYEKFYETENYKRVRDELDSDANATAVTGLVSDEGSDFTDYLNFFEMVTALMKAKQLSKADVLSLFQYYLECLSRHDAVMRYLKNPAKGYETLSAFLKG